MPSLTNAEKEKVRYHLGYVEGGPSSSRTILEYRMSNLRSHQHRQFIQDDIRECDYALERMRLDAQETGIASNTVTVGDLNRTTTVSTAESRKKRQQAYVEAGKTLAFHLGVEYLLAQQGQWQYTLDDVRTAPIDGPADTTIEGKIRASRRYL